MNASNFNTPERRLDVLPDVLVDRVRLLEAEAADVANLQARQRANEGATSLTTDYWGDNVRQIMQPPQPTERPDDPMPKPVDALTREQIARRDALQTYDNPDRGIAA